MATHDVKDLAQAMADYVDTGDSAQESLTRSTVGWTGKNKLKVTATTQTVNGVTFTVNPDKTVTANGTPTTGNYSEIVISPTYPVDYVRNCIISTGIESGAITQFCIVVSFRKADMTTNGDQRIASGEAVIEIPDNTAYVFFDCMIRTGYTANNLVFKPMLRPASIKDSTYEPYHESVEDSFKKIYLNLHEKMPAYVANALPQRHKDISDAYYNGSLKEQIAANDWSEIRPGDIIIGSSTGSKYAMAKANYRIGLGDNTNNTNYPAYGTPHMGMMLVEAKGITEVWAGLPYDGGSGHWSGLNRCPWNAAADVDPTSATAKGSNNTNISRTYNGASVSGYMGSFIRDRIDARLLPDLFQADFGSANVLKYREIHGNAVATDKVSGGQGNWNGCTSAWAWYDRFLDLPSEIELYGSRVFGSGMDHGCQCEQLPLFRTASIYEIFGRIDIWTKAVASSSNAADRYNSGYANGLSASYAYYACPLACIK